MLLVPILKIVFAKLTNTIALVSTRFLQKRKSPFPCSSQFDQLKSLTSILGILVGVE